MHIGLVLPAPPAYSETFFQSKIKGLVDSGHRVTLFTGSNNPNFILCPIVKSPEASGNKIKLLLLMGFSIFRLFLQTPKISSKYFRLERKSGHSYRTTLENLYLNSHILAFQLDWLHFGFATMALRRENVATAMGAKMGISFRGYDISIYPLKHSGCYDLTWKQVNKVHTISEDLLVEGIKQGLPNFVKVQKITPAIDTGKFTLSNNSKHLNFPVKILTIARLHWKKGLEYTLQSLSMLSKKGVDFEYTIIGEGEEYERLCFAAYQLKIHDKVNFLGKRSHDEVKKALEGTDIYLQYSLQEGFCNAVLEAQAMGLLCMVSDAEGLPENVIHGKTGWVVPKRQPAVLAKKIAEVLKMPNNKHQEIRQKAVDRVRREFNLEKQKREFLAFYVD